MQKIIYRDQIRHFSDRIDQTLIDYISDTYIETYESYDKFFLIAFDWYDIDDLSSAPAQIIIYFDMDDLFIICENKKSYEVCQSYFESAETNQRSLYLFFRNLFKGDAGHLEQVEDRISILDDSIMDGSAAWKREALTKLKYETLRLKKFYEPLESAFELLCDNDNGLISDEYIKYFVILRTRAAHLSSEVRTLREYVIQVRDSYLAQISIEQNDLMKVFTLVSSIFLPLTLIVGWYGMNFTNMPELHWKYGYLGIVALCLLVCGVWYYIFKKNKWFKK